MKKEVVLRRVANNIRVIRIEKNLTQKDLSYKSNLSLSQIARIETTRINPTIYTLNIIANALEVDICEVVKNQDGIKYILLQDIEPDGNEATKAKK